MKRKKTMLFFLAIFAIAAILMVLTVLINFAADFVQKYYEKRRNI